MAGLDTLDILFIGFAFLIQIVLITHFALRRWAFPTAVRYGPFVYALGIPAAGLSLAQMTAGKPWSIWLAGIIYFAWGLFGYFVEYAKGIQWRSPGHGAIFAIYITLYLAMQMFYWWPLANLYRPLWYVYAILFLVTTILNVASHRPATRPRPAA